ncbi:transcriptional antiterminator RfaH [Pseudomonas sp. LAMO17WK12:I10]|uniref:transcription/translation regulatory transformer protein RfaH n=1 Tax=unclassified Pseudomonas TaxID=196821 RepID=UPI000BD79E7A|nr:MULTISPECIES: transcription/translation regulatory transformer protein RfaH [unclassified Pseudomonas]PXX69522.1 transcriptional antiterminator RfaH [Pseudomonas sp. LAMO17WK12:I9]SNY33024.1 transcriptional antiterminator RfaH [Pseudomonas sp. LAMO17WK12:I10]
MNRPIDLPDIAWYLVQCKSRQDQRAQEHLLRQGFDCFCPAMTCETIKGGRFKQLTQPMFPGYLFVHLHAQDNWTALRATRGVSKVVSFSGQPCRVPDDIIGHLVQRCAIATVFKAFNPGDKVQVKVSSDAEMSAIFLAVDGEERVMLLLNILNRQQQIRVPLSYLVGRVAM